MEQADVILKSTHIYRGVGKDTFSGFVAVKGDKILYAGGSEMLERYCGKDTEVIDFGDQLIMPGLHDAHLHAFMSGLYADPQGEGQSG